MDEGRQPPGDNESTRPPLVTVNSPLSPLQQAYAAYAQHATRCLVCRDVDAGPCLKAEQLWKAYRVIGDDACDRLA
jgi:hypothetical protein